MTGCEGSCGDNQHMTDFLCAWQVLELRRQTKPGNQQHLSHHGSNESNESDEGNESCLCKGCKASCAGREGHQDSDRPFEERPREEQVGQDCQQKEECDCEGKPLECCCQSRPCGSENQGFLCDQKGLPTLQEGKRALRQEKVRWFSPARGSGIVVNALWSTHRAVEPRAW